MFWRTVWKMSGGIEFWSNICTKMPSDHEFSGIWKTNFNDTNLHQYNVFILNGKWCAFLRLIPVKNTILVYFLFITLILHLTYQPLNWTGIHLLQTKLQFGRTLIHSGRTNKNLTTKIFITYMDCEKNIHQPQTSLSLRFLSISPFSAASLFSSSSLRFASSV